MSSQGDQLCTPVSPLCERPMRSFMARSWIPRVHLATTLLCVACGKDASGGGRGGAVSTPRLSWADATPELIVPATSALGEVNFGRASGVARLASGDLAVLDRAGPEIRFFSPTGTFLRAIGRSGEGPGEFRAPTWIGNCGHDSLFVFNLAQQRISVRDPNGGYVRQFAVPTSVLGISCNGEGQVITLAMGDNLGMPSASAPLDSSAVTLEGVEGTSKVVARVPIGWNRPMGQVTWVASYSKGFVVARGDSGLLEVRSLDGKVVRRMSAGHVGPPPSPDEYSKAIERMLLFLSNPKDRERPREILRKIPAPTFVSAYRGIVVDPTDAIWVTTSPWGAGETVLEGVTIDGRAIGSLRFEGELDVLAIGMDFVLALGETPEGLQRVVVMRLNRGRN